MSTDKLSEIQMVTISLFQMLSVTVGQVLPCLGKANSCASSHVQLCCLCHVVQIGMLNIYCSIHLFCLLLSSLAVH